MAWGLAKTCDSGYNYTMKTEKPNLISMGQGCPVLLLHSSMSSKLQWFKLMQQMSRDYSMFALDFSGYGDSPFPLKTENYTLLDEIAHVESLLEDVLPAGEPVHLVGHSYGGATALRFCYKSPERIRSLTLFEPVAFHILEETDNALTNTLRRKQYIFDNLDKGHYSAAAESFIDYWSGAGTYSSFPEEVKNTFMGAIKKLRLDFQALVSEPLSLDDYKAIDLPVCLMAGKQSPMESRHVSELLAETLPHCRLQWVDGGHMAPVYQADVVNKIIEGFIRGIKG